MPEAVNAALIPVTAFGVSRAWKASAASRRPSLRLTKREYAGAPLAPFCAPERRRSVAPSVSPGAVVRTLVAVIGLPRCGTSPAAGGFGARRPVGASLLPGQGLGDRQ